MYILGISSFYHDSAACILFNGEILAAAQEERFTRIKHDSNFPTNAIKFCLEKANISPEQINHVVFYDKPFLKFERLLETYLTFAPKGLLSFTNSFMIWIKDKLFQKSSLNKFLSNEIESKVDWNKKLLFSEHHLSHAASAFFPSPFENSAILTLDGVGEWTTTTIAIGNKNNISLQKEIMFPHSLGLIYSAFTSFLGFKVNSGEYKIMGLAPYGEPVYTNRIRDNLIDIKDDGSFRLNIDYFNFCTGLTMTNKMFHKLFEAEPRRPETNLSQKDMNIAASIQKVLEEIIIKISKHIQKSTKQKNLCLSGGVALNCVANGALIKENIFKNIWIQPASGDAGGSLGAALAVYYMMKKKQRILLKKTDSMKGSYLGPNFSNLDVKARLEKLGAKFKQLHENVILKKASYLLSQKKVIGWFSGRMEFGPRSLGARSILADPRSETMQKNLNLKIKYRESFRPFAPAILREDLSDWFYLNIDSPYMLFVSDIKKSKRIKQRKTNKHLFGIDKLNQKRSTIPAVTHVDFSSRIQTIHKKTNPRFYQLVNEFKNLTGCPILVNTSFNVRGEPIVCTPEDAFKCFMGTDMDALVIENFLLIKEDQDQKYIKNYETNFEPD